MKFGNRLTKISLPVAVSALLAIAPQICGGQTRFEVASVKRAERCSLQKSMDAGMIGLNGFPLNVVIMEAFKVKMDQIVGPSWLAQDCFVITAKMPEGATKDQLPAMLLALLAERFKLAAHKESHMRSGYALVVEKNGPKCKESDPSSPSTDQVRFGSGSIRGSMSMASLVRSLSIRLGGPVEDLTGMKGRYDIDISWTPDPDLGSDPAGGGIFAAIRESLGLKLEARKQPVESLVIDQVDRVPAEN